MQALNKVSEALSWAAWVGTKWRIGSQLFAKSCRSTKDRGCRRSRSLPNSSKRKVRSWHWWHRLRPRASEWPQLRVAVPGARHSRQWRCLAEPMEGRTRSQGVLAAFGAPQTAADVEILVVIPICGMVSRRRIDAMSALVWDISPRIVQPRKTGIQSSQGWPRWRVLRRKKTHRPRESSCRPRSGGRLRSVGAQPGRRSRIRFPMGMEANLMDALLKVVVNLQLLWSTKPRCCWRPFDQWRQLRWNRWTMSLTVNTDQWHFLTVGPRVVYEWQSLGSVVPWSPCRWN